MGQQSSKRRSYTPGQDVQSEIPTNSLVNGDVKYDATTNGDIETHNKDKDVQMRAPKSLKPVERQSSSTGKKDKSKKIRIIGISLRRTPSGRWTRKRRSMRANGSARPTSCPVTDLKPRDEGSQLRPQSLFEEEVITEEEGKIETVDLSDNEDTEQAKSSQAAAAGPVPKPRDKKWGRGSSDKRQSSKKRKKDKKSSKKDKAKKPTSPKSTKAPGVPVTSSDISKKSAEDDDAKPAESTAEEPQKQNEAKDIDQVASSIVEESISIAHDRYVSEQNATAETETVTNQNEAPKPDETMAATVDVTHDSSIPVEDVIEPPKTALDNQSTPNTNVFSTQEEDEVEEDMIIPSQSLVREMVPIIFKVEDYNSEDDKGKENESDVKPQEPIEVQVEVLKIENETSDEPKTVTENDVDASSPREDLISETKDDDKEVVEEAIVQENVDRVKALPTLSINSPEKDNEEIKNDKETVNETEASEQIDPETNEHNEEHKNEISIAKEDVQNEVVEGTREEGNATAGNDETDGTTDEKETEHKIDADLVVSDNEGEKKLKTKLTKEQREKEKVEKERLKKQRDEEKAKEKERLKEERRKKHEQKSAEKVKLRAKGDRKSTISKRLSDWFKKDKTKTESSPTTAAEVNSDGAAGSSGAETNVEASAQPECANPESIDSQQNTSPAPHEVSASGSLAVDVSVQPFSDLASNETDQNTTPIPSPSDCASPDSASVSPVSNDISTSEPVTPTSDGEKSESSGGLKKILLGPRLRTAILRKKSSGASDNGAEEKRVSLTQPKGVETADVTPPPRKLRPRKPVEQYSPVTVGAHNPHKNTSPRLDHKDKDSLPDESDLDISCQESLPKKEDSTTVLPGGVVADVPIIITNNVDISSQSLDDHPSIENEPNIKSFNVDVENVENYQNLSSPDSQSQSENTSENIAPVDDVIEQSHTTNVSLETEPSIDSAISSGEIKEEIVESVRTEVKSEAIQNEKSEEESEMNHDNDHSEKEENDEDAPLQSPTLVSTARIVLRSTSNEGTVPEIASTSQSQSPSDSSDPVHADIQEHGEENSSPALVNKDCEESDKEISVVTDNEPKNEEGCNSDIPEVPEKVVCVFEKLDEVKMAVSDDVGKTSDNEKELLDEEEETSSSEYKVVCTAMSTNELEESNAAVVVTTEEHSENTNQDDLESTEEGKSADTEETLSNSEDADIQINSQQEESSDSSTDNNDAAQSTSSSSCDHWESPKLDIQLDDSAIEMDKESPLADTQSPVSLHSSIINNIKHEDEGVNSDNSSDSNDNNSDNIEKHNGGNSKADSADTIEAYLKLQQHVDVKDVSPKNHIVENCGLLEPEGFITRAENGVDDDENGLKNQDKEAPEVSTVSS